MKQINIYYTSKLIAGYLIFTLFYLQMFCLISGMSSEVYGANQPTCADRLDQAEEFYYDGEFDKTIEIVNKCLQDQSLSKIEQIRSYTILARTYLAKGNNQRTKENVQIILRLEPTYQPTIEQETPKYVNLVAEVKREQEQLAVAEDSTGISSWVWIGAGSVAAVAIIAIVASGNEDASAQEATLPKPPDFPE